jgi:hypothetical protein
VLSVKVGNYPASDSIRWHAGERPAAYLTRLHRKRRADRAVVAPAQSAVSVDGLTSFRSVNHAGDT